jgi:enoyl reductase-like protein
MSESDPVMVTGGLSPGHHLWKPQAEFDQYTYASLRKGPPVISSAGSAVIGTSV